MAKAKKNLDYTKVAQNIIANIGGKENIISVRHCITRVRFKLKDESKADDNVVKNLEGVMSVVHGGGEYMTVIGDAVIDVYDAVCAQLGNMEESGHGEETKEKVNPVMNVLNIIVGAVGPCLNFICAGGIIKGLLTVLEMAGLVQPGSGVDTLITAAGDAIFFFLPIFLGMNLAKTLKGDQFMGAVIGAILCYPAINGTDLVLFGRTFNYTYTSSFLPVIAVVAVAVPLAKALKKVLPKAVSNFMTPAITLLIVIPFGYTIIGPLVSIGGNLVNDGITALMNAVPLVAGAVFGGFYPVMILFGVHSALCSFSFMSLLEGNPDYIMAIGSTVCFAQSGVVLAIYLKSKDKNLKSVALPAFISGLFGITEPAIYGVTLPRIKMFILSCVGGAVCGAFIMLTNTMMYSFSGLGVFALLGILNPETPNVLVTALCAIVPFVFSFAVAFIDEEQISRAEIAKFKAQIADNEVKLEEARQFKATLYENYIDNLISKKDYRDLKTHYTEQVERAQEAIDLLREEMDRTMNSVSDRLRWTQHFKAFSTMATLDRRAVIAMVHSIKVMGKNDLEITFRYQMEFKQVLERLEKSGKITPPLLAILNTMRAEEKEAA